MNRIFIDKKQHIMCLNIYCDKTTEAPFKFPVIEHYNVHP